MIATLRRRGQDAADPAAAEAAARQDALDLTQLLQESLASGTERQALIVRLSLLAQGGAPASLPVRPQARVQSHHLRLARAALDPLLAAPRARLFHPPGADLVLVWRGEAGGALHSSLRGLAYLFAETMPDPALLTEHITLPADAAVLHALILRSLSPVGPPPPPVPTAPPIDLAGLATLEARLAQADMTRFVRRRDICGIAASGRFERAWERRFLSVAELSQALLPDRAAQGEPWLFRRLTRTLDRRMLALLAATGELRQAGPFSLGLNVASLLSPEFLRFDGALPAILRGQVTIELLPADLVADAATFVFARDFAQARGYRLLLRNVTAELLPVLPLDATGLDWLQLRWSEALAGLGDIGPAARLVLGHADTEAALAWGRARGIARFQGRLVVPGQEAALPSPSRATRRPLAAADVDLPLALTGHLSSNIALGGVPAGA